MNNMLVLFVIGDNLERGTGTCEVPDIYLLCGIGSNWVSMMAHTADTMQYQPGHPAQFLEWSAACFMWLRPTEGSWKI